MARIPKFKRLRNLDGRLELRLCKCGDQFLVKRKFPGSKCPGCLGMNQLVMAPQPRPYHQRRAPALPQSKIDQYNEESGRFRGVFK